MGVITYTRKNYPIVRETPAGFPECICGGSFKIQDCYNRETAFLGPKGEAKAHQGTIADCIICGEHFMGYGMEDIKQAVTSGQTVRKCCKFKPLIDQFTEAADSGPAWLLTDEDFAAICKKNLTTEDIAMVYMIDAEKERGVKFTRVIDGFIVEDLPF